VGSDKKFVFKSTMPRTSERANLVQHLEHMALYKELFEDSSDDDVDEDDLGIVIDWSTPVEMLAVIKKTRYLESRLPVPKSNHWVEEILPNLDDNRYRQQIRVSRSAFNFILRSIENHPVFRNNSPNEQLPIERQLHIALWRFGRLGN